MTFGIGIIIFSFGVIFGFGLASFIAMASDADEELDDPIENPPPRVVTRIFDGNHRRNYP